MNCKPLLATSATSCGWMLPTQANFGMGHRRSQWGNTFRCVVKCWHCFFYVTDGWKVYPMFIEAGDQIVSKTYMTRVERKHSSAALLARLHRKTLCYSSQ